MKTLFRQTTVEEKLKSKASSKLDCIRKSLCSIQRWKIEFALFWKQRYIFIVCVAIQFLHAPATNLAYFRHIQGPALRDSGFEILPPLPPYLRDISEYIFLFIFITLIVLGFLPFFFKNPPIYMACIWIRTLFVMAMCIILRCITFLSTSLPGPAMHCKLNSMDYKPPEDMYSILFRVNAFKGCGDLMFSSHTSLALCLVLSAFKYLPYFVKAKFYYYLIMYAMYFPLILMQVLLIISARKHYTVDIVVALYVTPLLYFVSFYIKPDVTFCEDLSPAVINNVNRIHEKHSSSIKRKGDKYGHYGHEFFEKQRLLSVVIESPVVSEKI